MARGFGTHRDDAMNRRCNNCECIVRLCRCRYYLSDQDLRDRLAEMPGDPEASTSCETWPPCGGCDGCIAAQQTYYFMREREWAWRVHNAGLELADPSVIDTQEIASHVGKFGGWGERHGEGGYHCWCAKEIDSPVFPWNRLGGA